MKLSFFRGVEEKHRAIAFGFSGTLLAFTSEYQFFRSATGGLNIRRELQSLVKDRQQSIRDILLCSQYIKCHYSPLIVSFM